MGTASTPRVRDKTEDLHIHLPLEIGIKITRPGSSDSHFEQTLTHSRIPALGSNTNPQGSLRNGRPRALSENVEYFQEAQQMYVGKRLHAQREETDRKRYHLNQIVVDSCIRTLSSEERYQWALFVSPPPLFFSLLFLLIFLFQQ